MATRIYVVSEGDTPIGLVRARSQSEALKHCLNGRKFGANVVNQDELLRLRDAGMVVEDIPKTTPATTAAAT